MGRRQENKWLDGIIGVVVGDALGVPYEFHSRDEMTQDPATDMRGYGTYNLPPGTWSDDSSMTLASLISLSESLRKDEPIDFRDMMERFASWAVKGEYTPYGEVFDIGRTTLDAIHRYQKNGQDIFHCGGSGEHDNGNGSLMRIMPVCLYAYELQKNQRLSDGDAVTLIHTASGLTHNHIRSKIACGLYYFCVRAVLDGEGSLADRLQSGIDQGWTFYKDTLEDKRELFFYNRCRRIHSLKETPEKDIFSGGYVVASFTAALWCLLNTDSYRDCVLQAVNLGFDTDTTAAITGGLAGLYYGYHDIPEEWLQKIARREWIEGLIHELLK